MPKIKDEFLMQFSLYFFGGLFIINGELGIGSLLVFMQYYAILTGAVNRISTSDSDLVTAYPKSDRILEELGKIKNASGQKRKEMLDYDISFKNVSYRYPGTDKNVLDNLSFQIAAGERVVITGSSGSGKTTILRLLTAQLTPDIGRIEFGGLNLSELSEKSLYKRIGFVMQENALFNDTINNNLRYAKNDATNGELIEACQKAYIYDFIGSLPDGLDTVIGERGIKLSGGQKQRLVLARLFLRDVDIFIFDEATSALDQYSESVIHQAINNIGKDKTIIIVAHRESSLRLCDRVIAI
jgi:ABC-type multidrug transport system fused ATPase/permease subunit